MSAHSVKTFNYVENFKCLAEKCENTCCQGWRISVTDKVANRYKKHHKNLFETLATDAGGYTVTGPEKGQCSFLNDGLCGIQSTYGEEMIPDTCYHFPRMYRSINDLVIGSATMSCPEIARHCLLDDEPFVLKDIRQPKLPELTETHLPGLDQLQILRLIKRFISAALATNPPAEQTILNIVAVTHALESMKYEDWLTAIDTFLDSARNERFNFDSAGKEQSSAHKRGKCQDIIVILVEMLNTHHIPASVRNRFYGAIEEVGEEQEQTLRLVLRDSYIEAYKGPAFDKINDVLKRFIAAEITRTGFPILSQSVFGKDYGTSLSAWGQKLTVRFLALRLLLISHIQADGQPPREETIIELVHRLSRKINHELSGPQENYFCTKTKHNFREVARNLVFNFK